jgi:2-hydroxychromene-2-carboxylate isomerase
MKTLHWYFDFISPYAWLQSTQLGTLRAQASIVCKPILFAGLLKHWGQKGPAEMATKRTFTYQQIAWYARENGLSLKFPARHPFNPLPLLRLSALLGNTDSVVSRLFRFVWQEGHLPDDPVAWRALLDELKVDPEKLELGSVKDQIKLNTEEALKLGVFGVPSFLEVEPSEPGAVLSPIFWGFDSTPMVQAWLAENSLFESEEFLGASRVGDGVVRKS